MRWIGIIRVMVILITLLSTWYLAGTFFSSKWEIRSSTLQNIFEKKRAEDVKDHKPHHKSHIKCGNEKACPEHYFAFKIISGAANVVGPTICFEDNILMSSVKNNIGRGLNMALVNATTGALIKTGHYDMYSGDVKEVQAFLNDMKDGTLILLASYDDPATKIDATLRDLFASLGSTYSKKVGFRDSWTFVGGKGIQNKSPFEQYIQNNKETNKYDGWPEVLEMEGCIPRKMN